MSSTSPTDPPAKPPRLRRYVVRALFAVACLATLIVAFFIEEKIRGRAAWRGYETEAKARGVKLDFADYLPPQIPDAENFASIPLFDEAFRASDANQSIQTFAKFEPYYYQRLPKSNDPVKQERIDLATRQKFFVEAKLLPAAGDNAAADVLKALDSFAAQLAQLREAGTRPHCHFPIHWEKGYDAMLPHTQILHTSATFFALSLSAHLALGDSAAAYADFQDGLRLTTATFEEPGLITSLVRLGIATAMENAVWGGLAGRQWAEPELQKIETDLAALDWFKDYRFAMCSERGLMNLVTDMLIAHPGSLHVLGRDNFPEKYEFRSYPAGWLYRDKVRANHFFDEMLTRIEPEQRSYFGARSFPSSPGDSMTLPKRLCDVLFPLLSPVNVAALKDVEKRYIQAATVTDLARLACALERCRLARGAFPQALSELTPDFLASLPAEIVNGEPYRYRRTGDGRFVLYSVGPDLRDDGGVIDPRHRFSKQHDWVWCYPAP